MICLRSCCSKCLLKWRKFVTAAWTDCTAQNLPNPLLRVFHHQFLMYIFSLNYCMTGKCNQYESNNGLQGLSQ